MKFFVYRFSIISIFSFIFSNLLYNFLILKFHESLASLLSLFIVLNLNIFFFFKLKIFKKTQKNYLRIVLISCSFRLFEFLLFNLFFFFILEQIQSNYIFALTLIISFFLKSVVFNMYSLLSCCPYGSDR